jgi:uncharacterized protein YuzE
MVIGENEEFRWDYDEDADIFNIHRKDVKVKGSAELGDFTVDFDSKGQVVGLEIMYASEFLENVNISKSQLINIKSANLFKDYKKCGCMKTEKEIREILNNIIKLRDKQRRTWSKLKDKKEINWMLTVITENNAKVDLLYEILEGSGQKTSKQNL